MTTITFTVLGDPVPQPRPRVSTRGGFARAYVPKSHPVHEFRQRIALAAQAAGLVQTASPVSVLIEARFRRPQSHYRKSGIKPSAPPLPRPDCDNIAKAVLDALQEALGDDTKVSRLLVVKRWDAVASTIVVVVPEGNADGRQNGHEGLGEVLAAKIEGEPRDDTVTG